MGSKYRIWIVFGILLVGTLVLALGGLPYVRYSVALAQVDSYSYDEDEDGAPAGVPSCDGIDASDAILGSVVVTTPIYWEPVIGSAIAIAICRAAP